MTQGSAFGRRGGRGQSDNTGSGRVSRHKEAQLPTGEPLPEEQPAQDPVQQVLRYSTVVLAVVVAGLVGTWTVLPSTTHVAQSSGDQINSRQIQVAAWSGNNTDVAGAAEQGDNEADKATEPSPDTAVTTRVAQGKNGVAGGNEQQRTAALQFFGYYHLAGRARADYCATQGVDMAAFTTKLRQSQHAYFVRASEIAQAAGLTVEKIYADSRAELAELVAKDMQKVGQQTGMGPAGGCQMMATHADRLLPNMDFAKIMPDAHRVLMGL